ncbi:MAG: type VI secretion system-associated FHA domain protein TagH [Massilia sp.]
MSLTLRIQSYRKEPPAAPVERRFDRLGGTIGRAAGNDLELPDPGKYISRTHCKLDFVDGRYTLIDLGSNPSWLNDRPLGAGKSATLGDGDTLIIGDYVLQVGVDAEQAPQPVPVFAPEYSPGHPFQAQPAAPPLQAAPGYADPKDTLAGANILDTGAGMAASGSAGDPLGLDLFGHDGAAAGALAFRGSEPDHAAPERVPMEAAAVASPFQAPAAVSAAPPQALIPDDYDPLADFLPPRLQAAPAAASPAPRPAPPAAAVPEGEVLQALLRGLGLADLKLAGPPAETAELVGAMLREATAGTMAVLLARAMTKRESRLELTVMGAQANNPLKFFPDAESALAQMLTNAMAGYMPPLKSFGSAFDDLKAHEMAVIAGMRAALAGVLARFNPAVIEQRMEPEGVMDKVLASSRKARMWDRMVALYDEIAREAEDDFQRLFGERFSAAYEDQIGRLHQGQHRQE